MSAVVARGSGRQRKVRRKRKPVTCLRCGWTWVPYGRHHAGAVRQSNLSLALLAHAATGAPRGGAAMTTPDYETDFYAWMQQQAQALRAHEWAALDIEHLAEEVADLWKWDVTTSICSCWAYWNSPMGPAATTWACTIGNRRWWTITGGCWPIAWRTARGWSLPARPRRSGLRLGPREAADAPHPAEREAPGDLPLDLRAAARRALVAT